MLLALAAVDDVARDGDELVLAGRGLSHNTVVQPVDGEAAPGRPQGGRRRLGSWGGTLRRSW
jgi:hypothetical protein